MASDQRMIGEYKVSRTSKRCSEQDRPLRPGEIYYSVLIGKDEEFQRRDISAEAWQGPPEDCIGHWKNKVPMPDEKKRELAPPEILIELLRSMADQPARAKSRYLLGLMLLRKRQVKLAADLPAANNDASGDDSKDLLRLELPSGEETVEILVCDIASTESESLQAELIDLIYRDVE